MNTHADIIKTFTEAAEELEAAIAPTPGCTVISSHNWIVLDPYGQPCKFDVQRIGGKTCKATVIGKGMPHKVSRWEKKAAEKIAAQLGDCTIAHWQDVAAQKAAEFRDMIKLASA